MLNHIMILSKTRNKIGKIDSYNLYDNPFFKICLVFFKKTKRFSLYKHDLNDPRHGCSLISITCMACHNDDY